MRRSFVFLLLLASLALGGCTALQGLLGGLVNDPPKAVADAQPTSGQAPLEVRFDASYSRDDQAIATYFWDFGDPNDVSTGEEPMSAHTYRLPGTYVAKLTVIDREGVLDSTQVAIKVENAVPVAAFSLSSDAPLAGEPVQVDASASHDPNGTIEDYDWDFGDGTTAVGPTAAHAYSKEGYAVITLTITDNAGATSLLRKGLNVQTQGATCGEDTSGGSCGGSGSSVPKAVISGLPGCTGITVGRNLHLDGSGSFGGVGGIVAYQWDFGDGATASGPQVEHTYTVPGRYYVLLTVTDERGNTGKASGACSVMGTGAPQG
jgi:PKD repeat protein